MAAFRRETTRSCGRWGRGALASRALLFSSLVASAGCDRESHASHASTSLPKPSRESKGAALGVPAQRAPVALAPAASERVELAPIEIRPFEHPLAKLGPTALEGLVLNDPGALGSLSVGRPNRGKLLNAVPMPENRLWKIAEPKFAWGTRETVLAIQAAILRVEEEHPGSPALYVGHISRPQGGWLRPHRSHQSGRDADLGFYYLNGERWYAEPKAEDFDRARTWTLLLGLVAQGNVEYVFMARQVQALLVEHARSLGTDEAFLADLFSVADGSKTALVRHRWGHHTHLHVRFYSDDACEAGERAFSILRKNRKI